MKVKLFAPCRAALCVWFMILGIVPSADAVDIQSVAITDDVEAWLIEDHTNPIIAVEIAFRGGAALDPPGKEGRAHLALALLDEGAGNLTSQAFKQLLQDQSIEMNFDADRDGVFATMRTLSSHRDSAFNLLRLAMTAPRFDEAAVERVREQLAASLRRSEENPSWVATRRFYKNLFPHHPYGRSPQGTVSSLKALSTPDLRAFTHERLTRASMVVGVVGDITASELKRQLGSVIAKLPASSPSVEISDAKLAGGGDPFIEILTPQSAIVFGQEGLKRDDPDFYALLLVNQVLGGSGFTSRLFSSVRESRGLAYSIYTRLQPMNHAALIVGQAATANETAEETIDVIREEWQRMARSGLTEPELSDAKTYLTGSFPLRFSSSSRIASLLVAIQWDNMGIDYIDRRNQLIDAVSLEEANAVARRIFRPDSLKFVVAGQPGGLLPPHPADIRQEGQRDM